MTDANPVAIAAQVAWGGFALALVFGYVGAKTNFCTMGAVSDIVTMGDWSRMRMWLLAIAVAIVGSGALELSGAVKLANSFYTSAQFNWLSHLVGGLLFGFGMVLGSGCGSKTLMRVGNGNLKSAVVLVFLAIAAYMTMRGLFAPLRVGVLEQAGILLAGTQDLPAVLARATGGDRTVWLMLCTLLIGGGLAAFVLARAEGRSRDVLLGGITIGAVVVGGWWLTGVFGFLEEHPETLKEAWVGTNSGRMESLTFVGPQAYTLELLMLWTDKSKGVTFGIASALGVIAGSFLHGLFNRGLRLESFRDPEDMLNHIAAGVLMGFGGVTALGCTIGQGLTGLSTLALGSIITFAGIVVGARAALGYQVWRFDQIEIAAARA